MPNYRSIKAAAERRRQTRPTAERVYQQHRDEVPSLIRQLAGPAQADHDRAFDLLQQMSDVIVDELLAALANPTLDPIAVDEVVSLLSVAGAEQARDPIWEFFQANRDDPERASTAALSLSGLGDERMLPYLRDSLDSKDAEIVSNAAAGMIFLGELEDIPRLRAVHIRYPTHPEIRLAVASAILAILEETDRRTFERTLDEIQHSFADRRLWDDIWNILDEQFGRGRPTLH